MSQSRMQALSALASCLLMGYSLGAPCQEAPDRSASEYSLPAQAVPAQAVPAQAVPAQPLELPAHPTSSVSDPATPASVLNGALLDQIVPGSVARGQVVQKMTVEGVIAPSQVPGQADPFAGAAAQNPAPGQTRGLVLRQSDVEEAVRRAYPPLLAAYQEINQANADALAAKGRFDTRLKGRAENNALGYYENRVVDVGVEQPLRWGGVDLFGGWRIGQGTFPVYEGKYDTRSGGEYRVGARLPLLQDRTIDSRRADLRKTAINQQGAGLSVEQQRLAIMNNAIQRYWLWVAAGNRLAIARDVLTTAASRQSLLELGATSGQLPAIEAVDNRRAILQREGQVLEATRGLQAAALDLSLLYRDASGQPIVPTESQLPPSVEESQVPEPQKVAASVALAQERRPEAQRVATQRAAAELDLKVAKNQKMPDLDLTTLFTSEKGTSDTVRRGPQEFRAGVVFELPVQRRQAEGRIRAAQARIEQYRQREQFARDTIREEVLDAISALTTTGQRLKLAQEELRVTRQLEAAERSKFDLGEGNLFLLNLREQATLDSALKNVTALADQQRALSVYRYSIADF